MITSAHPARRRWILVSLVALILGIQAVLITPTASADGPCAEPPLPERLNAGMVGALDPATHKGSAGSAYSGYGYAGMVWHTYDVGDRVTCTDPHASIHTTFGSWMFNAAKGMVGATNGLHYLVEEGGLAYQLDELVKLGSTATYEGFAIPFLPIALLIVALVLFKAVFAGKLSEVASGVGRVAIALTFIAATALSPLLYSQLFDRVLMDGIRDVEGNMAEQLYGDDVVARDVMPTVLHNNVVYDSWLRGEFGDEDSKEAQQHGRKLLDAQAFSWGEMRDGDDGKKEVIEAKQEKFEQVAKDLEGTPAYQTFTGAGGDRFGAGGFALIKAGLTTPIQFVSKVGILFAQLALRILVLFGPLIGMFMLVNNVANRVFRGILGVGVFGVVFWAVASLHTFLMDRILNSEMSTIAQLTVMFLITVMMWAVARPYRRLKGLAQSSMNSMPGKGMERAFGWMRNRRLRKALRGRRGGRVWTLWDGNRFGQKNQQPDDGGGEDEPGTTYVTATRPEAATSATATPYAARAGAIAGVASRDHSGPGTDSGAAPPPPPSPPGGRGGGGNPRGGDPTGSGGAGTVFAFPGSQPYDAPRGPIRAEATRLYEPDGSTYSPRTGVHSADDTQQALPSSAGGRTEADNLPAVASDGGDVDERDIVIPSDVDDGDDTTGTRRRIREASSHTDSRGRRVWSVYDPATDQVVDQPEPPARPEAQTDPARSSDNTPVKGDNDADPN